MLGHDEPSPEAAHLFRRCGPIWLTFAAAHAVAATARRAARLVGAGLAARNRDRDRRALGAVPGDQPPGREAGPAAGRSRQPGDGGRLRLALATLATARWTTSKDSPTAAGACGDIPRGRRGVADPQHLPEALPLPRLSRRDRRSAPTTWSFSTCIASAAPSTTTGIEPAPRRCFSAISVACKGCAPPTRAAPGWSAAGGSSQGSDAAARRLRPDPGPAATAHLRHRSAPRSRPRST